MILYNVTVSVDRDIEQEWLAWMRSNHILDVINTGMFQTAKVYKLLNVQDEGATYAVQYFTDSLEKIEIYQRDYAKALQAEVTERYRDKFVAFRTLMEEV
ncbi:MAG TPA: DUF4286 domain-containing protein [Cytophagales bacterium]|nr:DUF4286 domain-containing protein [Cytophagales bacterium]HAA21966.1 DUF4286 domain-containing protein [Cytophagales bacterium]HAP61337.1 DUF4286 domain-containing protein [Cytophagales bacterium]